jgi:hypothetical protein
MIDDLEDAALRAGLDEKGDEVGAVGAARAGLEDEGRHGMALLVARDAGEADVSDLEVVFDVGEEVWLHPQDRLGVLVEVGILVGAGGEGDEHEREAADSAGAEGGKVHAGLDEGGPRTVSNFQFQFGAKRSFAGSKKAFPNGVWERGQVFFGCVMVKIV